MNLSAAEKASLRGMYDEMRRDLDDAERYRAVRLLGPRQFRELYEKALLGPKTFDELVDELRKEQ